VVAEPLGSAGGMRRIQDFSGFFDSTAIVLCGDALIDLDLKSALFEHRRKGAIASLVAKEVRPEQVSDYGIVVADREGRIESFQEKPAPAQARSNWANTGIYIFEPEAIQLIPPGRVFDIGSELFPLIVSRKLPFYCQRRFFNWIDIGRVSDYWDVLQRVMVGQVADFNIPGTEVTPGVWRGLNTRIDMRETTIVGPVYFGSGCTVEPGATIIGPTWIGHGSHVCAGAHVSQSVLFEYTRVPSGARLHQMIVCGEYAAGRSGAVVRAGEGDACARWSDSRTREDAAAWSLSVSCEPVEAGTAGSPK
jgi:mannose-1-phosphate guanylyltransferase